MLVVDRMPRNRFISLGLLSCTICLILEACLTRYYLGTTNSAGLGAAVAMIFLLGAAFSIFLDGPSYFYVAEIWPTHLRAHGLVLSMCTYCITTIVWLQAAPTAIDNIGWKYYLFFIVVTGTGAIIVLLFFPDTLHKPLEEIAALFGDDDEVAVFQRDLVSSSVPLTTIDDLITGRVPNEKEIGSQELDKTSEVQRKQITEIESIGA